MHKFDEAKRFLRDVKGEHHFKIHMGTNIRNMHELAEALEIMAPESFGHHAMQQRNDFANWVKDCIGDKELADRIAKAGTRKAMTDAVSARIKEHEKTVATGGFDAGEILRSNIADFAVGIAIGFFGFALIRAVM